ncbi:MAG: MarR family transcriptional regulator [Anaerofustis stercorihominis]|nr:MarR family transcriptional regulator [Anaerofustis stercorihominis]
MNRLSFEAQVLNGYKEVDTFFTAFLDNFTAMNDLSSVQIKAIMEIYLRKHISMKDLCTRLGMSKSNLSPVCKKLEGADLIRKTRDYHDQRIVNLELTEKGAEVIEVLQGEMKEYAQPYLKRLSDDEKEVVLKGFEYLAKVLNK